MYESMRFHEVFRPHHPLDLSLIDLLIGIEQVLYSSLPYGEEREVEMKRLESSLDRDLVFGWCGLMITADNKIMGSELVVNRKSKKTKGITLNKPIKKAD